MDKEDAYAKGYRCECGKYNEYPVYVFAHWSEILTHTCECKNQYNIRHGLAIKKEQK
jgi:hypothetical protein